MICALVQFSGVSPKGSHEKKTEEHLGKVQGNPAETAQLHKDRRTRRESPALWSRRFLAASMTTPNPPYR
jgi:hypothetical protein